MKKQFIAVVLATAFTASWGVTTATGRLGACCDGLICTMEVQATCEATEGAVFLGDGTDCTDDPCAQIGACCLAAGGCSPATEQDCTMAGGTFAGLGSSCPSGICDLGACCLGGTCQQLAVVNCLAQGGLFTAPGASCTPDPCSIGPAAMKQDVSWRQVWIVAIREGRFRAPEATARGPIRVVPRGRAVSRAAVATTSRKRTARASAANGWARALTA